MGASARAQRHAQQYTRSVAQLLQRDGYLVELERRVRKQLSAPDGRAYIPFDISFLVLTPLPHREYIECKYRERRLVDERDVAKFLADLRVCALPTRHALMATNSEYSPLARDYARAEGLRLYTVTPSALSLLDRLASTATRPYRLARALLWGALPREFIMR